MRCGRLRDLGDRRPRPTPWTRRGFIFKNIVLEQLTYTCFFSCSHSKAQMDHEFAKSTFVWGRALSRNLVAALPPSAGSPTHLCGEHTGA